MYTSVYNIPCWDIILINDSILFMNTWAIIANPTAYKPTIVRLQCWRGFFSTIHHMWSARRLNITSFISLIGAADKNGRPSRWSRSISITKRQLNALVLDNCLERFVFAKIFEHIWGFKGGVIFWFGPTPTWLTTST